MKKFILIALVIAALQASASETLSIKPVVSDPRCNGGNTGAIILSVSGGTTPYSYSWSNSLPASPAQSGLKAGTYSVTVSDHNGITSSYSMTIGQPSALSLTTSAQNASAHGANDGCINLQVSGGTPDYEFQWSNNATLQSMCGLQAGTYFVTVTDAFQCTATASKTISQPMQAAHTGANGNMPTGSLGQTGGSTSSNNVNEVENNSAGDLTGIEATVGIYPIPANDLLYVSIAENTSSKLTIYNALGQVVLQRITEDEVTALNVSNLTKGNYIVCVKNETGTTNRLITIVK